MTTLSDKQKRILAKDLRNGSKVIVTSGVTGRTVAGTVRDVLSEQFTWTPDNDRATTKYCLFTDDWKPL